MSLLKFFFGLIVVLCLPWIKIYAQVVVPDDKDYFVIDSKEYRYIFPEEYRNLYPKVRYYNEAINYDYKKSFRWQLDELTSLLLASSHNQIANAFVTSYFNNQSVFYNGGAILVDQFANQSWLFSLITHEMAHLYQINPKKGPSKIYHKILGNSYFPHLFFVLPIFTTPNFLLPTWLLEGNAVLNESRFGNGGRLFSGEERALFYSLINAGVLDEARLTNNHYFFPFTHEKYIVGGYFFNFLAKTYGVHVVNSFFLRHATHFINPFRVSSTFEETFGLRYSTAIDKFIQYYEGLAKDQKRSKAKLMASSLNLGTLNRDKDKIYFLTNDGKRWPQLIQIDRKTLKIQKQMIDLPSGKVFKMFDGKFYSATYGLVDRKRIYYSLWGEANQDLKDYRHKIVLDVKGKNTLFFDAKKSFDQPKLFLNDRYLGEVHSTALFDEENVPYYFKQDGEVRSLYRGDEKLASFKSYYGKVVDVGPEKEVYYIASTKYGSSLFMVKNGKSLRVSDSDVIVDAKLLSGGRFFVCEVAHDKYEYKIINTSKQLEELPHYYSYFFNQNNESKLYPTLKSNFKKILPDGPQAVKRDYSFFRDIRFSGVTSFIYTNGEYWNLSLDATFTDPLNYHQFNLVGKRGEFIGEDSFNFSYTNKIYLLRWFLSYKRDMHYKTENYPDKKKEHDDIGTIGMYIPFWDYGNTNFYFTQAVSYENLKSVFRSYSSLQVIYNKTFQLSFYPYRYRSILFEYDRDEKGHYTNSVWGNWVHDFGYEFVATFDMGHKQSNEDELDLNGPIGELDYPVSSHGLILTSGDKKLKKGGKLGFKLSKVINQGLYFSKFPISLMRFSPTFLINHIYYQLEKKRDFQEFGYGLDVELLLGHLAPVKFSLMFFQNEGRQDDALIGLKYKGTF